MTDEKILLALRIIAGVDTPHEHWDKFLSEKKPKRDYPGEYREEYWNGLNEKVKIAACELIRAAICGVSIPAVRRK